MLFIRKKVINQLAEPYREPDMVCCYVESQSMASTTSRAILLINHNTMKVLFLNFFSTKVVHTMQWNTADLYNHSFLSRMPLVSIWSFDAGGEHWRFLINKFILTLGSMQGDFLDFISHHIVHEYQL
ncbi:hypothetical protein ACE3MZ_19325 [Paenibacillus sp. WLX1005]|uniref:hypothetical protein n=1 Tax=Paenibacillus sp. WLX1005 TaxID=3243766 RepID=UPI00398454D1